jgi:isopenicillin-N epimerase
MRDLFLLDPDVVFLNHGSYGACPRPVFEEYQRLQRELERNPVEFLGRDRRFPELHDAARDKLARYVGADPENLVFVPNATTGMNVVASALELAPGDEVVITDHEYGAIDLLWRVVCERAGARLVRVEVPVPLADVAETVLGAVTPRTRALVVSHITSPTALVFPVEELCRGARAAGVLAVVDGAHAPGQVPLRLEELGADFYAGNCHKWLCAPKGAGFLYARPEQHSRLHPPVLSWDFEAGGFSERHRYQGTRDPAAYLAVPAAIRFQAEHGWDHIQARCHQLADRTRLSLAELTGLAPLSGAHGFVQMVAAELTPCDPASLQRRLREEHGIEVPVREWNGRILIRVSVQAYNDEAEVTAVLEALPLVL